MASRYYKLVNHEAVPCDDVLEWAKHFGSSDNIVQQDNIGDMQVTTIFLGINLNLIRVGPPVLFETMVFNGHTRIACRVVPLSTGYQERCSTWAQAVEMHARAVAMIKTQLGLGEDSLPVPSAPSSAADLSKRGP